MGSTVQSCSSPATMQILIKCFILALLVHNSLQLNQAAKCEEGCVEGFCNTRCAYTEADTICTCTKRVSDGNEGPIECVQPDGQLQAVEAVLGRGRQPRSGSAY